MKARWQIVRGGEVLADIDLDAIGVPVATIRPGYWTPAEHGILSTGVVRLGRNSLDSFASLLGGPEARVVSF